MRQSTHRLLMLNLIAAVGIYLGGASIARAEDPAKGRCCQQDTSWIKHCCVDCCFSINKCATSSDCKKKAEEF